MFFSQERTEAPQRLLALQALQARLNLRRPVLRARTTFLAMPLDGAPVRTRQSGPRQPARRDLTAHLREFHRHRNRPHRVSCRGGLPASIALGARSSSPGNQIRSTLYRFFVECATGPRGTPAGRRCKDTLCCTAIERKDKENGGRGGEVSRGSGMAEKENAPRFGSEKLERNALVFAKPNVTDCRLYASSRDTNSAFCPLC